MTALPPTIVAISLKMYFTHARTLEWCRRVRGIADSHDAVGPDGTGLLVLPTFPALVGAREILGDAVALGAQDVAVADHGPHTGEVGAPELAEIGCTVAEIGHAERRAAGEDDSVVGAKVVAALRNGLVPLVCVGEATRTGPDAAAAGVAAELDRVLAPARDAGLLPAPLIVAYEPHWAIGAPEPAPAEHVAAVCGRLRTELDSVGGSTRVLYGGSAGPGLLGRLGGTVHGLFLGRSAHDPDAIVRVLDETTGREADT
ncbi:triose-phosphate isomerase family protein [Pseudonocardia nematodicida]|uniref:Triosephosphate isomerase n=1 Tax=Pseudonocardia nematodicida TaxID=1206997 RepID=A0ABV1KGT2_9PSEU